MEWTADVSAGDWLRERLDEGAAWGESMHGVVPRGYTAYANEVAPMTDGSKYQIALLLKSTPLHALEELGKTNEVMPPKSTFFYPKGFARRHCCFYQIRPSSKALRGS